MSHRVRIVEHSRAPHGGEICTFELMYPYMIHAELMTHRVFSRNAASTRAIPAKRMIEWVRSDTAMPVHWGKNQKGMQMGQELGLDDIEACRSTWLDARNNAIEAAQRLMAIGTHKSIANRVMLPFMHINVVVTATSYDNWFALRCDAAADTLIQILAVRMARLLRDSKPTELAKGEWHLPYVTDEERARFDHWTLAKLSTARCGRVSLKTEEGQPPDVDKDIAWHDARLAQGHWSPFEHPARVNMARLETSGNFTGWHQYRQMLPKSVHSKFDYATLDRFGDRDYIIE